MEIVKKYGEEMKKRANTKPETVLSMMKLGMKAEGLRTKYLADKDLPKAYRYLNHLAVKKTEEALEHPEQSAWTNIFAPVEILQCFNLIPVSIECLSSFISGFKCEDYFMDYAENMGIAQTLCAYHRNFIGGVDSGVLPIPSFSVTTSMVCDGNINTFRYLSQKNHLSHMTLDIPNTYSIEARDYLVVQLKDMIKRLEVETGKTFDIQALKATLERENQSKAAYKRFLELQKEHQYPSTLTLQMFMLFATHLYIGTPEVLTFFEMLEEEIKAYPPKTAQSIFWVHLFPYYQETLQSYFNISADYQIDLCDINLDNMEELDVEHPLEALASKMINNIYNGSFSRKIEAIEKYVDDFNTDALIHFCHWGCKQSAGGVMLLKEKMTEKGIPMLILDGDGMDRRNSHDGQIKTRLEAFLEILQSKQAKGRIS